MSYPNNIINTKSLENTPKYYSCRDTSGCFKIDNYFSELTDDAQRDQCIKNLGLHEFEVNGIVGGSKNQILYQTNTNKTGFIEVPANNTVLEFINGKFVWNPNKYVTKITSNVSYEKGEAIEDSDRFQTTFNSTISAPESGGDLVYVTTKLLNNDQWLANYSLGMAKNITAKFESIDKHITNQGNALSSKIDTSSVYDDILGDTGIEEDTWEGCRHIKQNSLLVPAIKQLDSAIWEKTAREDFEQLESNIEMSLGAPIGSMIMSWQGDIPNDVTDAFEGDVKMLSELVLNQDRHLKNEITNTQNQIKSNAVKMVNIFLQNIESRGGTISKEQWDELDDPAYSKKIILVSGTVDPYAMQGVNMTGGDECEVSCMCIANKLDDNTYMFDLFSSILDTGGGISGIINGKFHIEKNQDNSYTWTSSVLATHLFN